MAPVAMIHEGASIKAQFDRSDMTQATLSTAQLFYYNTTLPIGDVLEAQDVIIQRLEKRQCPFMLD